MRWFCGTRTGVLWISLLCLVFAPGQLLGVDPPSDKVVRRPTAEELRQADERSQKVLEEFEEEKHRIAVEDRARRNKEAASVLPKLLNEQGYGLPAGRNLIHLIPKETFERTEYLGLTLGYRRDNRGKFDLRPDGFVFASDGSSLDCRASSSTTIGFGFLVESVFGLRACYLDAPDRVYKARLPGDWVVRESSRHRPELLVNEFERILNDEFQLSIKASYRDVRKPVYVATGDYAHRPLDPDQKPRTVLYYKQRFPVDHIDIYARERRTTERNFMPVELAGLLAAVSDRIRMPIIDEIRTPPTNVIAVHEHYSSLWNGERDMNSDPEWILPRINEQTAIEFHKEDRVIKMLVIEDASVQP